MGNEALLKANKADDASAGGLTPEEKRIIAKGILYGRNIAHAQTIRCNAQKVKEITEAIRLYDRNYVHTDWGDEKFRESLLRWLNNFEAKHLAKIKEE